MWEFFLHPSFSPRGFQSIFQLTKFRQRYIWYLPISSLLWLLTFALVTRAASWRRRTSPVSVTALYFGKSVPIGWFGTCWHVIVLMLLITLSCLEFYQGLISTWLKDVGCHLICSGCWAAFLFLWLLQLVFVTYIRFRLWHRSYRIWW